MLRRFQNGDPSRRRFQEVGDDGPFGPQALRDARDGLAIDARVLQETAVAPDRLARRIARQGFERRVYIDNRIVFTPGVRHGDRDAGVHQGVEQRPGQRAQRLQRLAGLLMACRGVGLGHDQSVTSSLATGATMVRLRRRPAR